MSLRAYIASLDAAARLRRVSVPVNRVFEAAGLMHAQDGQPLWLERISDSDLPLVANLYCYKADLARYFEKTSRELLPYLVAAIDRPQKPTLAQSAACREVTRPPEDLERLPILRHAQDDGGSFISAGVVVAAHPELGQNLDFHRMMQVGKNELAVRVVEGRHLDVFLARHQGKLPIACCIGNGPSVMLAAATSVALGQDELELAAALEPLEVTSALTFAGHLPADCEIVLEGVLDATRKTAEGPFIDLTGTYDGVREQPIFTVTRITHRKDALYEALLPGGLEHKLLMGMPREPTIWRAVNAAGVRCTDVHINPGGCSWLHAIVQIDKQRDDDGVRAIHAAFAGHGSLKHCFVVDRDIDPYNPLEVEWAMATRFQGDRALVQLGRKRGSSLDPSGDPGTYLTAKLGYDLTKPLGQAAKAYERAAYPTIDLSRFESQQEPRGSDAAR